ncbi:Gfo/Idh/MocA family protein [Phycisphaera mikurensis]|uniref:Putative oxidoreductase n=1 Tax=Phycisphaera mikurensis (strain NBRC 102666 / KCTC 22515 / FYK2301M01) TaxID=1142394 RepID=I0IFU0_PHYMF|nr:Gfo/Idh/MocA family oxidoreductase [Phycisphaera mikurensis]MBB6440483.1 putative dehydrogenase [Phycisphaera mikurensis]BAM04128.1 putative oxidoreductase [Phycisphaera mikurensis NBRC 102666]
MPDPRPLRTALLGCGRIARGRHLPMLVRSERFHVLAVVDPDQRSRAAAEKLAPGASGHADPAALYADDPSAEGAVEAVVIATPSHLHGENARAAIAAGRHVYLEKPVGTDLDDARATVAAWDAANADRGEKLVGRIGFNYRFHPMHRAARAAIESGRLGRLVAVRSVYTTPATELPGWKTARASGGGALLDLAIHHVDNLRFLTGREVTSVRGRLLSRASEHDTATLDLLFGEGEDAVPGQITVAMNAVDEDRTEVIGDRGAAVLDRVADGVARFRGAKRAGLRRARARAALASLRPQRIPGVAPKPEPSTSASLHAFAAAVRGEGAGEPDLRDGLAALEVVLAAEAGALALARGGTPDG